MTDFVININGHNTTVQADSDTPLLWVLRDNLQLTGTKFGCGIGQCGACTVHVDGQAVRSCSVPVSTLGTKKVITIEGVSGKVKSALDEAWKNYDVPQCGYCQAGQLMNASAMLERNSKPTDDEIVNVMNGNICRCGTYTRIKKAIRRASDRL